MRLFFEVIRQLHTQHKRRISRSWRLKPLFKDYILSLQKQRFDWAEQIRVSFSPAWYKHQSCESSAGIHLVRNRSDELHSVTTPIDSYLKWSHGEVEGNLALKGYLKTHFAETCTNKLPAWHERDPKCVKKIVCNCKEKQPPRIHNFEICGNFQCQLYVRFARPYGHAEMFFSSSSFFFLLLHTNSKCKDASGCLSAEIIETYGHLHYCAWNSLVMNSFIFFK